MTDFIKELELSVRASNVLRKIEPAVDSPERFLSLTSNVVRSIPGSGARTWAEVKELQDAMKAGGAKTTSEDREFLDRAAIAAMQGWLSNPETYKEGNQMDQGRFIEAIVSASWNCAHALLKGRK